MNFDSPETLSRISAGLGMAVGSGAVCNALNLSKDIANVQAHPDTVALSAILGIVSFALLVCAAGINARK